MIGGTMTTAARCEKTVLAWNLMVDREMVWTIRVIVTGAYNWTRGRKIPYAPGDVNCIERLVRAFGDKFTRIRETSCAVLHSELAEPDVSGMYAVWSGVSDRLPQPGAAAELMLQRGNSVRIGGSGAYAWQELPEGPVLEQELQDLVDRCSSIFGWEWNNLDKNLALSLMFDQEMIDTLDRLLVYARSWCIGYASPSSQDAESICALIHGFVERFNEALKCAVYVTECSVKGPDLPGVYVVWMEDRQADPGLYSPRSAAKWAPDKGWNIPDVALWMPPPVYPDQSKDLARLLAQSPEEDYRVTKEILEWCDENEK